MAIAPSSSPPITVLAVEDDPAVAYAIAAVLRGANCNITPAASVDEAVATIARHPRGFDVIITDNNMPGGSGRDLVRRLRTSDYRGKIVVLSACVSAEQEIEYRELGVTELVPKPFSLGELRRAVGL